MKYKMISALIKDCYAKIAMAECNVNAFLETPCGVGDHPNVIETIQGQLDIMSQNKDRLNILMEYFDGED